MASSQGQPSGPPYPPTTEGVGGLPSVTVDIPPTAVFLFIYLCFAAANMTIFQVNRRRGHKFLVSSVLFGFCMCRTVTTILRIVWATDHHNVSLGIAAQIFVNAGILLIYIVNLILAQRILRAKQPRLGWNPFLRILLKVFYVLIGVALIMVITAIVLSFYTLNEHTKQTCRDIQLAAITYLFIFTIIPAVLLALAFLLPRSDIEESFGHGRTGKKALIPLASTILCIIIAGFRCGTTWETPRPLGAEEAWYDSKAAFYVFNFCLEVIVLTLFLSTRIDKRFHIPNGSKGPGDYSRMRMISPEMRLVADAPPQLTLGSL